MSYLVVLFMQGLLIGMIAVASNPSPYFGALGLVVVSGMGCGMMMLLGGTFLSLILFLIYLGGMLVVFAYSSALASDLYPDTLGLPRLAFNCLLYFGGLLGGAGYAMGGWYGGAGYCREAGLSVIREDLSGVSLIFSSGGRVLLLVGVALLMTLLVVLEVVRGLVRGALRAV
uniref:NADH-ubiquinone oxidoreductase chain 6 n=2 Tax=Acentrogobius TaxID=376738 RepID=A0A411GXU9_9GOBI|nr:NADH dehydrogenase subunit 6 [Acentrogobius caninus]AKU36827.1 NADH dehydrogenase subunit 6 [Acentrogobius sp. QHY-2015]QBB10825.1 NADH dehydrogenase subunit 6 [Acentrogobius caninus]